MQMNLRMATVDLCDFFPDAKCSLCFQDKRIVNEPMFLAPKPLRYARGGVEKISGHFLGIAVFFRRGLPGGFCYISIENRKSLSCGTLLVRK